MVRTVATTGEGVDTLAEAIEKFVEHQRAEGRLQARRENAWKTRLMQMAQREVLRQADARGLNAAAMEKQAAAVSAGEANPYDVVQQLAGNVMGAPELYLIISVSQ